MFCISTAVKCLYSDIQYNWYIWYTVLVVCGMQSVLVVCGLQSVHCRLWIAFSGFPSVDCTQWLVSGF